MPLIEDPDYGVLETKSPTADTSNSDLSLSVSLSSIHKERKSSCFVDPAENFPSSRYYRFQTLQRPNPWSQSFEVEDEEDSLLPSDVSHEPPMTPVDEKKKQKFGTWDGVFTSCFLNIMGVILFLRLGWVVGSVGLFGAILIILMSSVVTVLTTLSMSAMATNGTVRGGGAYYLISRAVGPAIGGSVGFLFSIGMSVATAMYVIGFCEALIDTYSGTVTGSEVGDIRLFGSIVLFLLFILCLGDLSWVIKTQFGLVGTIIVVLFAFFIGSLYHEDDSKGIVGPAGWKSGTLGRNLSPTEGQGQDHEFSFLEVFGVFFPAVTGIMAGANISGDLNDPGTDIPYGTLAAVGVTTVLYILCAVFLAAVVEGSTLVEDYLVMRYVAIWDGFILGGIYAASLSSAITSIVGAPRILCALAKDNLIPILEPFGRTRNGDPFNGTVILTMLSWCFVMAGDLNAIAIFITMFFMICYGTINFACFMLSLSHSPGWRPGFRYYNAYTALAGGLFCVTIMVFLDAFVTIITSLIAYAIFQYIQYRKPEVKWGSAFQARAHMKAFTRILQLEKPHVKNFRPGYLVLTGKPTERPHLIRWIHTLHLGYGTTVFANIQIGDFRKKAKQISEQDYYLPKQLKMKGLVQNVVAPSFRTGVQMLLQTTGLGDLRCNTLVMGLQTEWLKKERSVFTSPDNSGEKHMGEYVDIIRDALSYNFGIMITKNLGQINYRIDSDAKYFHGFVDVWWLLDDGGLSLLVPYLMSEDQYWRSVTVGNTNQCGIRLFLVTDELVGSTKDGSIHETFVCGANTDVAKLLKDLRMISWVGPIEIISSRREPAEKTVKDYHNLCPDRDPSAIVKRWLRVSELITKHSNGHGFVYVTAPWPDEKLTAREYVGLLEMLANSVSPTPLALIRGSGKNVLTLHSE